MLSPFKSPIYLLSFVIRLCVLIFAGWVVQSFNSWFIVGFPLGLIFLVISGLLITNRVIRLLLLLPFVLLQGFQLANIYVTGRLIDSLTLLNLGETDSVGSVVITTTCICAGWLALWLPDFFNKHQNVRFNGLLGFVTALALLITNLFTPITASGDFRTKAVTAWKIEYFEPEPTDGKRFFRPVISERKIPPQLNGQTLDFKNWNVILIFTEGTSLLPISEELMPNSYRLMKSGISVENYFNHTAATFRGIRGQLISGYQLKGGAQKKGDGIGQITGDSIESIYKGRTESLPEILNKHGYQTVFLSPHAPEFGLNVLMEAIGFQKVIGLGDDRNTDKETYEALWKETEQLGKADKPFFLATYILGTHVGMDSPHLKWKDGKNPELNKYHNQDHWFGEYLKKLEKASFSKKTLLILTTDHASYPTSDYKETFHSKNNTFIDKIPFVIWHKGIQPSVIDADGQNSLMLAPTIADLLDLRAEPTHFLGHSVFDPSKGLVDRLSVFDFESYETTRDGVGPKTLLYDLPEDKRDFVEEFFSYGR